MPRRWLLLWLALLLPASGVLCAEEESGWEEPRFYVGGLFANCTVLGEFTGDLYLSDGYQLFAIPEVGSGWGFGGLAGMRMRRFGGEVSYTRSSHVGMWTFASFRCGGGRSSRSRSSAPASSSSRCSTA